jgi:hypothetical protein
MTQHIDVIVEAVVPESDGYFWAKVLAAITADKQAIGLLTMHQNLSAEVKEFFQNLIDDFYEM